MAAITLTLLVKAYHSCPGSFNPTGTSLSNLTDSIFCNKFAFAASADGSDIADLTTASRHLAGSSSTTHGYRHGGLSNVDIIERWSHTTDGNSVDVGNLVSGHDGMTGNHY